MEINFILLRQISVLSVFFGAVLGFITLIPFVNSISFIFLITCMAPLVIYLLIKYNCLTLTSIKESIVIGAIAGFVAFLSFSAIYIPISILLIKVVKYVPNYGLALLFNNSGFFILLVVSLFMGVLSATVNAFTGFITFSVLELISSIGKK